MKTEHAFAASEFLGLPRCKRGRLGFARLYNGEDYSKFKYDTKMQEAYNKFNGK
jgi:hypothetical protein